MSTTGDHSLRRWLERRTADWRSLAARLATRGDDSARETVRLVEGLQNLGRDLALARNLVPGGRLVAWLRGLYLRGHEHLHRPPRAFLAQSVEALRDRLPATLHAIRRRITAVVALFVGSGAIGWWLVASYPELASLFASEQMIAEVQRGRLWTDDLLNVMPSSLLSLGIMTNNIVVSLTAFVLGALYGLGTVYIIGLNGLMLGGVFAFTAQHGLAHRLAEFVVAHGIVELSVICLAGAAGVGLGEAIMRPGARTRSEAFRIAVREGGDILFVGVLFLVGAGLIEGYVSPAADYGWWSRITIGLAYFVVLLLVLSGWIWRPFAQRAGDDQTLRRPRSRS